MSYFLVETKLAVMSSLRGGGCDIVTGTPLGIDDITETISDT